MTRKTLLALAALTISGSLSAQDIYKVETFSGSDLNGTARFVGMGGAMSALGADLSTMGTNPAGIGLYRHSDAALTGSVTVQPGAEEFYDIKKARTSFDQAGFVYALKVGGEKFKFLNIGFNYQKTRNTKNFLSARAALSGGMSQTWQLAQLAGSADLYDSNTRYGYEPITNVAYDTQLLDPTFDANEKVTGYNPVDATDYNYLRAQWGGIQQFNFNVAFNVSDRFYGGITCGVYNVNLHSGTYYDEGLTADYVDADGNSTYYYMNSEEAITGTGVDVKLGFIFRPIENNPLRIGFAVSSPTFYELSADTYVYMNSPFAFTDETVKTYHPNASGNEKETYASMLTEDFKYRIRTPWKVNISAATTVGKSLALDAEYEVSNYSSASISYPDYDNHDWGTGWTRGTKDQALNQENKDWLKAVHTVRVGAEVRLAKNLSGRVGYNYVSSAFKKNAYLNLFTTNSQSYYARTNTDYVNLGATNRFTCGLGYRGKHFYGDIAYQYQHQTGDLYAFDYATDADIQKGVTNQLQAQKVDLNRHNVMLTIGYKF